MLFNREYNRITSRWVKSKAEVSGSNKKPFQQKKTGRARQGCKRAPHLKKGGSAHGARPREFYFSLNKKVRLIGLKSLLSSKFADNKIIVVDTEKVDNLNASFKFLEENKTLFMTNQESGESFLKKIKKIKDIRYITPITPNKLNVLTLISNTYLIFTVKGLIEFQKLLSNRQSNYYRNKKIPLEPELQKKELETDKFKFKFNPGNPLKLYTPILKNSYEEIVYHKNNPNAIMNKVLKDREEQQAKKLKEIIEKQQKNIDFLYDDNNKLYEKRKKQINNERKMKILKELKREKLKKIAKEKAKKQQSATVALDKKRKK